MNLSSYAIVPHLEILPEILRVCPCLLVIVIFHKEHSLHSTPNNYKDCTY